MTISARSFKDEALAALRAGNPDAAHAAAQRAVTLDPTFAEGWAALGTVMLVRGDADSAQRHLAHALSLKPVMPEVRLNHAMALMGLGRLEDALNSVESALTLDPCLQAGGALGRLIPALRDRFQASAAPADGALLTRALLIVGDAEGAEATVRRCLEATPEDGEMWGLAGAVMMRLGRVQEAEAMAQRAAALSPDDPEPMVNIAGLRLSRGDTQGALEQARAATRRFPRSCRAWTMLCDLLDDDDDTGWEALKAAAACPDATAAVLSRAAEAATQRVDWDVAEARTESLASRLGSEGANPFRLLAQNLPPEAIRHNAERHCAEIHPLRRPIHQPAQPKAILRLGYLSPDFGPHPVGTTVTDLFRHHDRARFQVHAYAVGPDRPSPERQAIQAATDSFTSLSAMTDLDAARRIRDDGIDILIELAGHTRHNRLGIAAFRPAPLQLHYLGYPATIGAPFMDYMVGDPWTVPPAHDAHFTEAVIRLPHTYLVNSRRPPAAPGWDRTRFGFRPDQVILCSFNHPHKITRVLFACWMAVLRAVPAAVLWLRADHPAAIAALKTAAAADGIAPERLVFAPRCAFDVHLARYGVAELMLDTIPYNAHTTAADALWMGCPVLTAPGMTFASRVCAGLLAAAGCADTIARDLADYQARAIDLARDAQARAALRHRLAAVRDGVLFDNASFARLFEAGLSTAWERLLAGQPPATFTVPAT